MMKKLLALVLVLAMCACASAMAAEWAEGLGPQKPYAASPEIDFNESFGYMMFLPVNGQWVAPGTSTLSIFLPREDIQVGEGELKLFSKEDGQMEEIAVSAETLVQRAMTEAELEGLVWGSGTVFEVKLANPLEPNKHYYVQLSKGSIVSPDFEVASPALSGKKAWTFSTEVESYVESVSFLRVVEGEEEPTVVENPMVGDTAKVSIVLGEDAAAAALYCNAGTFSTEETYFEESAETTLYFPANGEVEWGVIFMDAEGKLVYTKDFVTKVMDPASIVDELLADAAKAE